MEKATTKKFTEDKPKMANTRKGDVYTKPALQKKSNKIVKASF
jgi:hypothetical protein